MSLPSLTASPYPTARAERSPVGLVGLCRVWLGRWRHRRSLAGLHPEQMREVGLNPEAVRRVINRPFWRA